MKHKLPVLFTIFLLLHSYAMARDFAIVATVGSNAISTVDLDERINLAITSSGLANTPQTREKIQPQILKTLINESLYLQEAKELRIEATPEDLKSAIMNLELQNKLPPGTFDDFLKKSGIPVDAMKNQIGLQIIWSKILNQKVRPQIIITDKELDEQLEHISNTSGIYELDLSEIVLPVDSPIDAQKVKELADKLFAEIKEGADFKSVAKEFSRSSTASNGGSLGWIREEHTQKEIIAKIRNLQVGEVSTPFYENSNYYIMKLNDRKAFVNDPNSVKKVKVKHAFVQIQGNLPKSEIIKIQENIKSNIAKYKSCNDFSKFAKNINSKIPSDTIDVSLDELNPEVRPAIAQTDVGSLTPPIASPDGLHIFGICEKEKPQTSLILKDRLKEMLTMRKLDLQAQRHLQQLRDKAFIEIRM